MKDSTADSLRGFEMEEDNAVEVRNVCKTFKVRVKGSDGKIRTEHVKAADGLSFDVSKGQVVGIIGRNGSGKSSLLSMISGIMFPDSGTIEKNGKIASILELGLGFQNDLSGRENIYIKGEMFGFKKSEIESKIDDIIRYSDLGDAIDRPVRTYSTGMTGKLAFSIISCVDADILLIDEILSVGDLSFSTKAGVHFKKMASEGKTIILVSHSMPIINDMCTKVIWIDSGKIVEEGDPRVVVGHYQTMISESPDVLTELAESGDPGAQNRLGCMYRDGIRVDQDYHKSFEMFSSASMNGWAESQVHLGDLYLEGKGIEKNKEKAEYWYRLAAEKNNPEGRKRLAALIGNSFPDDPIREETINTLKIISTNDSSGKILSLIGDAIYFNKKNSADVLEAIKYYRKAAELGHSPSFYQLGNIYLNGKDLERNTEKAISFYEKGADLGNQQCQLALAEIYYDGILVSRDYKRSFRRYLQASENGNFNAMYRAGIMLLDGKGTTKNRKAAEKWFLISSHRDLLSSFVTIGNHYESVGNISEALKWHDRASALGFVRSSNFITDAIRKGLIPNPGNEVLAEMLKKSIDRENIHAAEELYSMTSQGEIDNPEMKKFAFAKLKEFSNSNFMASRIIGNYYFSGIGTNADGNIALQWYLRAANQGDIWSTNKAAEMLRKGIGVEQNSDEAARLYEMSASRGNLDAASMLYEMSIDGEINNEKIKQQSLRQIKSQALARDPRACKNLGLIFSTGKGVPTDGIEAIKWLEIAGNNGDASAFNIIADIFRQGKIIKKNSEKAAYYYKKSAQMGNNLGSFKLYEMAIRNEIPVSGNDESRWALEKMKNLGL